MRKKMEHVLKPIKWFNDGLIRDALLTEAFEIETRYGTLVPRYKRDESRQKFSKSISFYQDGTIKSIVPQKQTLLKTKLGDFPAELVTFHANGTVHRIFPLNGQIDGFWSETDEGTLAEKHAFDLPVGKFSVKVNSIQFYPDGNFKGISFWPGEMVDLDTPQGTVRCRMGFNVHPNGALKSYEPAVSQKVETPIGDILAFDYDAIGIHADKNTVAFDAHGLVKSVGTPLTSIIVKSKEGDKKRISPIKTTNPLDNEQLLIISTKIAFSATSVIINDVEYPLAAYDISTHNMTMISGQGNQGLISLSI